VSSHLPELIRRWDGFLKKAALRLRAKLGAEVQPSIPRKDVKDPDGRIKRLHAAALKHGNLSGELKVPDAVGDIAVTVILQAKAVRYGVAVQPPSEGRARTRVNWLLRQFKGLEAPEKLIVRVDWDQARLVS
jgi:hypothetical protein